MANLYLVLVAALAVVTLLPLSRSHRWWVRMWDFPRLQIAGAQVACLGAAWLAPPPLRWVAVAATLPCLALHLVRIWPFTPLAPKEMRFARPRADGAEVTLLSANVLMQNDRFGAVRDLIDGADPDVVLLMETDRRWLDALMPALSRYPTLLHEPRDDCYGLVFATRLPVEEARIVHLTPDRKPAVFAALATPSGRPFRFVGLHPQPPVPGVDTEERDAQILYASRFAHKDAVPQVTMGDFNDAAWSDTAQLFKRYGRYLDPRVGRGLYASFHASNWLIRCAIDQLYVTEEVAVVDFRVGGRIGSDHFPILARVRIDAEEARGLNIAPPRLTDEERAELQERMEDYRRALEQGPAARGAD
mgnify:CR=1 FL=1